MVAEYFRTFLGFKDLNHLFVSSFSILRKEKDYFMPLFKSLLIALILECSV